MSPGTSSVAKENADVGWDTYAERVLRNEGRLEGLEQLVRETRASDAKLIEQRAAALEKLVETVRIADARLIEQRSDSLAEALKEAREDLKKLMDEQRQADRDEFRSELAAAKELNERLRSEQVLRFAERLEAMQEATLISITKNYEQSNAQIKAADDRAVARWGSMEQQVVNWRLADREARELQASETARRLEMLNHAQSNLSDFQSRSVTRELWQAGEHTTNDKIIAVEKAILGLSTNEAADKAHKTLEEKIEASAKTQANVAEARFKVIEEKVADLKESRAGVAGRSQGYAALYGWAVAALGLLISVVIVANTLLGKA